MVAYIEEGSASQTKMLKSINKSAQMKKDDMLLGNTSSNRLVSKENSIANPSFRVLYYGGVSGAVPFMWETQPGTPKHKFFCDHSTPPTLTPPPAYCFSSPQQKKPLKKNHDYFSKKLLNNLFFSLKKSKLPMSPSSLSSSSSYSSSQSVPPSHSKVINKVYGRRRVLSTGASFDDYEEDIDHDYRVSATKHTRSNSTSILCFGGRIRF